MKTLTTLLTLSLIAGMAFANLAPTQSSGDKAAVASPIELAMAPMPVDASQGLTCDGPYLGQCSNITFTPGDCDCDVPEVIGTCEDFNGRSWEVFACYGSIYCNIGSYCPPS